MTVREFLDTRDTKDTKEIPLGLALCVHRVLCVEAFCGEER
jgi:hypothetical protein